METESNSTYIKVPKSVIQLGAIAILFVIIDLIGGLIDYIQEPEMRISRIIMRSISILGWTCVEYLAIDAIWQNHKHKSQD